MKNQSWIYRCDSILFFLMLFISTLTYMFLCLQFALFPLILAFHFANCAKWLNIFLNKVLFYITCFLLALVLLILLTNWTLLHFHFAFNFLNDYTGLLESFKDNVLFNSSYPQNGAPVNSKEASFEDITQLNASHQQLVVVGGSKIFLICCETDFDIYSQGMFRTTYPFFSGEQEFIKKHYVSAVKISNCSNASGTKDPILAVGAYTHASGTEFKIPNLFLYPKDLVGKAAAQYTTQFYQVDCDFIKFIYKSDKRLAEREFYNTNRIVPLKTLSTFSKHQGLLVTGERQFLQNNIVNFQNRLFPTLREFVIAHNSSHFDFKKQLIVTGTQNQKLLKKT